MSLRKNEKEILLKIIDSSNSFLIFTTGRAGTDFLQSCYDSHQQVASTSEKCNTFFKFLEKNRIVLKNSKNLFASLAVNELMYSFAPYLNLIEDWQIKPEDKYKNANCKIFMESLTFLLEKNKSKDLSDLYILRSIILSFRFSLNKNIKEIKTILIHLHHLDQLKHYSNSLSGKDLIIICSRNIFDLVASGVFHWNYYYIKSLQFDYLNNSKRYRDAYVRSVNDKNKTKIYTGQKMYLTMLEKLYDLDYLNKINNLLEIKSFKKYPKSTVLGIKRRPDLLSKNENNISGSFNKSLVQRGSPFKRLGLIDSILLAISHPNRIKEYKIYPESRLLNLLIEANILIRLLIFFSLILFPTKIELTYLFKIPINLFKLIMCRDLKIKIKILQIFKSCFYIINIPIELIIIRIIRINGFIDDYKKTFIKEIR